MFHHHPDSLEHKLLDETLGSKSHYAGNGTFEPAIEAVSSDVKQQELDGRYVCNNSQSWTILSLVSLLNFILSFLSIGVSVSGICIKSI